MFTTLLCNIQTVAMTFEYEVKDLILIKQKGVFLFESIYQLQSKNRQKSNSIYLQFYFATINILG